MPKVSQQHRQARRDQIAQAAVQQFLQHGIHSTTMANITEQSGLSAGAIYTHFASKDDIIAYVANSTIETVLAGVERAVEADPLPSPAQVLQLIITGIPAAGVDTRLIVQAWGEAVTNPAVRQTVNTAFRRLHGAFREYLTLWLASGAGLDLKQARERATPRSRLLFTLASSYILQTALLDDTDPESFLTDLRDFIDESLGRS